MKFTILKENLKQGLLTVSHLNNKNINLPILNNVLIKVKKEGIELTSTNLELSVKSFIRAKVETEGEFTVDSRALSDYVNLLPESKIEIEKYSNELKIECENYKTKIRGQGAEDFPVLPEFSDKYNYLIKLIDFKKALSSVIFSISNNENRVELSGVFFDFTKDFLTLVGTDSYRLSEKKIKIEKNNLGDKSLIIPAKTIQELIRILNNLKVDDQIEGNDFIKISLSDNQIFFSFFSTEVSSRLIIGNYPDYQQIIPKNKKTEIVINKEDLVRGVKSAGIFSKIGINDVRLEFKNKKTIISSSSSNLGENSIELKSEIKGSDVEIFINYKYLLEGVNNINSEKIVLELVDNDTPCMIKGYGFKDFLYLIMPIKQ